LSKTASKKKPAKRGGNGHDSDVAEVGQDELLGQQQPGDAVSAN
jgi:arginine decarboxylase